MDAGEGQSISFVVRIWVEETHPLQWRGHITHVPSGEQQYIQQLPDLNRFIDGFINQLNGSASVSSD